MVFRAVRGGRSPQTSYTSRAVLTCWPASINDVASTCSRWRAGTGAQVAPSHTFNGPRIRNRTSAPPHMQPLMRHSQATAERTARRRIEPCQLRDVRIREGSTPSGAECDPARTVEWVLLLDRLGPPTLQEGEESTALLG